MTKRPYLAALLLTCVMGAAHASPQQQQYAADSREAAARYAEDRAICNDERNQGQRMKCLRTAKAENTSALAEAKRNLNTANKQRSGASCLDCGRITAVNVSEKRGDSNALGVVAGGAAGALLGHQVGGGRGKDLATIAGAVGGAYAGKKIQEKVNATKVWTVDVQYDNGQRGNFTYDADPGVKVGDRVQKAGQFIKRI